jgi:hypothetical protein
VTEDDVLKGLAKRHADDVFLTHVYNGPWQYARTHSGGCCIDAIALKKSYAHPCVTGYEVKVSRADFHRDSKWPSYLYMCHRLYFATPAKLVTAADLPSPDLGLVWVYSSGTVRTVRDVPMRPVELTAAFLMALIFWKLDDDKPPFYGSKRLYAQAYIRDKAERRTIGQELGSKMGKRLAELEEERRHYQKHEQTAEDLFILLRNFGVNEWHWQEELAQRLKSGLSASTLHIFRRAVEGMTRELQELGVLPKAEEPQGEDQDEGTGI